MDGLLTKQELDLLHSPLRSPLHRQLDLLELAAAERRAARPRGILGWFSSLPARISDWIERQQAVAELRTLNDRELADIGMTRGEIGSIARL